MPPDKNKPNAFYYFMLDWRKKEETKGRIFNNMKDVENDPKLHEAWKNLTSNERLIHKEKEKNSKLKQNLNKKNNLGESVDELLQIQMREKNFHDHMKEYISSVIKEAKINNSVHKLKFYAIHVNYYCIYDCESLYKYCPAEIALVEFSLEKGVVRSYNKIINSEIRKGYAHEVNMHSNSTHQIPKEPDFGEKNYGQIFKEICDFVKPNKVNERLPPLFTLFGIEIVKESVISVLDFLASFDKKCSNNFVVYSFEKLFVNLYNNLKDESYDAIDEVIVSLQIKKDPFDYRNSLCCDFHKIGSGGNFCSKSIVQRWIFILFSHVCSLLDINLVPGYHMPIENSDCNHERELNRSFSALNVLEDTYASQALSSWDIMKCPSERTYRDKEVRKAQSKPLLVTFHGSFDSDSANSSIFSHERSAPSPTECEFNYLKYRAITNLNADSRSDESTGIHVADNNFPAIGRGAVLKRYVQRNKSSNVGHSSCFK